MSRIGTAITLLALSACAYDGEAGSADYYLQNDSSEIVVLEWTGYYGGDPMTTEPIAPGTSLMFFSDGSIGGNPSPSSSFASLRLLADDTRDELYVQDPIDESMWVADPEELEGYELQTWTLVVTDAMLPP